MEPIDFLKSVLEKDHFSVQPEISHLFSVYQKLILEWNRRINLISRSDEARIVTRHFLQSIGLLKVVSFPLGSTVLDIGSGAGFPGVPIKLVRPDLDMILGESMKKKAHFLKEVIRQLHLLNIQVHDARIDEDRFLKTPVDFVIARAVANLCDLVRWSFPSLKPNGKLIAIKGIKAEEELAALRKSNKLQISNIISIPYNPYPQFFLLKESVVVVVER